MDGADMNILALARFSLLPLSLSAIAAAQVQLPVNPRATYLRTAEAAAQPAPAIPLSAIGAVPGQYLRISTSGAFGYNGGSDTTRNLACVFSSNTSLLAASLTQRVPGAIAAGPALVTAANSGSALTDIAQDFVIGRNTWANGTLVLVPVGATHLFLSVFATSGANSWGNHSDPNNDFAVVFTPVSPATLQGTAEHPERLTGVGGTATATPDVKPAAAFTTLSVEVAQRYGVSTNDIWLLGVNLFPTGGAPPVGPLPNFHMGSTFVIAQTGVTTTNPGQWSFFVPPGYAGTTLVLQGFFLNSTARNGILSASDAHRIELQ
jgi:hypothetical protein